MSPKNWILFCVMALLWGAGWSVTKIGLGFVPPFSFSAQQFLLSATILLPYVMASRGSVPKDRKTWGRIVVYSLINAANIAVTNLGLLYESAGTAAVLTFTQPLIVYGLSIAFLRTEVKAYKLLGVLIGFLGVSALSLRGTGGDVTFSSMSLLMVLGAFFWAVATLYFKASLEGVNVAVTMTIQQAIGFLVLFALGQCFEGFPFPLNVEYCSILLFMSIGPAVLGMTIWLFLLRREDPTVLSTYGFIVPIIALFFGWWILGEPVVERSFLGATLIIVGVYLVQKQPRN